jgi:hypothetical protein
MRVIWLNAASGGPPGAAVGPPGKVKAVGGVRT